jgi:hypothetical protein
VRWTWDVLDDELSVESYSESEVMPFTSVETILQSLCYGLRLRAYMRAFMQPQALTIMADVRIPEGTKEV